MACIHLYHGNGKGKTTAAAGLAFRAAAAGMGVCIVQFLKSRASGEMRLLSEMTGVTVLRGKAGEHFTNAMTAEERAETLKISNRNCMSAYTMAVNGMAELVILDEACAAWKEDLVNHALIEKFFSDELKNTEIVLTGRNPPPLFVEKADYITEFVKIRHPFDNGLTAREGIEY